MGLQIKSIPSVSRNLLCGESHYLTGEAKASEHLKMNPHSPPNSGGGEKKSLKLAEEIIVRAKTDARKEKRSNSGLSKK